MLRCRAKITYRQLRQESRCFGVEGEMDAGKGGGLRAARANSRRGRRRGQLAVVALEAHVPQTQNVSCENAHPHHTPLLPSLDLRRLERTKSDGRSPPDERHQGWDEREKRDVVVEGARLAFCPSPPAVVEEDSERHSEERREACWPNGGDLSPREGEVRLVGQRGRREDRRRAQPTVPSFPGEPTRPSDLSGQTGNLWSHHQSNPASTAIVAALVPVRRP